MNSRFIGVDEIIKTIILRQGQDAASRAAIYQSYIDSVYLDFKMDATKQVVFRKYKINKANNSLVLPTDLLLLLSVGFINECGGLTGMYYNHKMPKDLLFENDVKCDCKCGCDGNCNTVKINTTVLEQIELKNGIKADKKTILYTSANGVVYRNVDMPYLDTRNNVKYITTEEEICKVDLDKCGCIKQTANNIVATAKIDECCGTMNSCCGEKDCIENNDVMGYSINLQGNTILLSSAYKKDYIVLKYYTIAKSKNDYKIPQIAKEAFIQGIMYYDAINTSKSNSEISTRATIYRAEKNKVKSRLHPYNYTQLLKSIGITI